MEKSVKNRRPLISPYSRIRLAYNSLWGYAKTVTMAAANVAHKGENFGDEDDMIFVTMEYDDNRFAVLEWGSAFRWGEHYVLIQGEKGAIKLDMYNTKGTLRVDGKDTYFPHSRNPRRR